MKYKKVNILFIVFLCILLSSCASKTITNKNVKDNNIVKQKEEFFGTWIIKKHISVCTIGIYSKEDVEKFIGKEIYYSEKKASFGNSVCKNPVYEKIFISAEDFTQQYRITPEQISISADPLMEVTVYPDKRKRFPWFSTGNDFYIKDKNTLIMCDQGDYFELERKK